MTAFKKVHDSGTEAVLRQEPDGWRIRIDLREVTHEPVTIVGYLQPTLELAKLLADKKILDQGHVCNGTCDDWEES